MSTANDLAEYAEEILRPEKSIVLSRSAQDLFRPMRYKVRRGGRGSGKSWDVAGALVVIAHTQPKERIGCFRELQTSIKDSVHRLLVDQIDRFGLTRFFRITDRSITSKETGSEFIFKGLRHNANEIKSTEGLTRGWVEEAQLVSADSWELLIPTMRGKGSEIWVTYNPVEEKDATHTMFPLNGEPNQRPQSDVREQNWYNNPWFPAELELERAYMLQVDPVAYEHVWEGKCRLIGDAVIFKGKFVIDSFEPPSNARYFQGLDFGFSNDPTAFVRCYITGEWPNEELWISDELGGHNIEIDEIAGMLRMGVRGCGQWPIKADCSRPESISYLKRQGLQITGAEKWDGSVEDGISHLRSLRMIHIHQRCKRTAQEFRLYSWKVDKKSKDVLPIPVDAHNHFCIAEGELITTARGDVPVESVVIGDMVLTRDGYKRVYDAQLTDDRAEIYELCYGHSGRLRATANHKIYTFGRGFIELQNLMLSDYLHTVSDGVTVVCGLRNTRHLSRVYDLSVEDAHEFFAGGILVSNCDAIRYALDGYIKKRGANKNWELLGK